ncbi:MAG TPA: tetratricopeptide repeat protein [Ktedonobacterales bacterium]
MVLTDEQGNNQQPDVSRRSTPLATSVNFLPQHGPNAQFNNLPTPLTSLVGREQEVAAVCALLQQPEVRLVTLTGTGGIGKTRLGLEVSAQLLTTFPAGVCFVPLASVSHSEQVLPTIVHLLDLVQQQSGHQHELDQEHLRAFLRDKQFLLVLDNFEQVIEASPQLTDLLASCPQLKLLVTSRAVLHVQGEHEFAVPPLAVPKRTHLPAVEVLAQYAAVNLFLQRAQAIKPDFARTKANLQAIATICVHLDGLPLAIELAAARIKLLPPPVLLQRLTHPLDVLTAGTRDVPLRQQTLRNTLAWSYNLLEEWEQQLFRQLAVFVGGCTLEAIEAVHRAITNKEGPVLDGVASLIDKSLLLSLEHEGEEPRLRMLATIREYGLELLSATQERAIAHQAHAHYYLALAEQATPEYGGARQALWLDRLEREHDNLRAALQWSLEQVETRGDEASSSLALRLSIALRRFWLVHAHVIEGRDFMEQALAASTDAPPSLRAQALLAAANLVIAASDYARAEALSQEALTLCRHLGDQAGVAFSLHLLGSTLWVRGNLAAGRPLVEESLALFRELGDLDQTAWALSQLGMIESSRGEYDKACALFEESLALHRKMKHQRGIAFSVTHLAQALFASQSTQATVDTLLEEGLALSKALGDKDGLAYAHALRGRIALSQGDLSTAYSLLEESVLLYREAGSRHGLAEALAQLAQVDTALGEWTAAQAHYEESLATAKVLSNRGLRAFCLEGLASLATRQGVFARAAQLWGEAEALRQSSDVPLPPIERIEYDRAVAAARSHLSDAIFVAAWKLGRALVPAPTPATQQEAPGLPEPLASTTPVASYPAGLTAREVEVLRLVARGLTNNQMAEELGLSEKTIAHHLTHIFHKTTSENRAAAVAFAFRHHLV